MRKLFVTFAICLAGVPAIAQDLTVLGKIRHEAAQASQVEQISYQLLDKTGSRLAGSDGAERGYKAACELMEAFGLTNPRIDFARNWHRGGWEIERAYTAMTAPYYLHIFPALVGWTGGTHGMVKGEVVLIEAPDSISFVKKYAGKLKGKITLMPSTISYTMSFAPMASRQTPEGLEQLKKVPVTPVKPRVKAPGSKLADWVRAEKPLAVVNESGDFNNPGITFYDHTEGENPVAPEFNVTLEVHGLMERMIQNGEKVEMELDIRTRFIKNRPIRNVIAEIPGTDPALKGEIVLLGAHIDSYHQSPGAGDDGAGCIAMLEAIRILKKLEIKPRRTIRIALWGGEEVGIHGSRGYVEQYVGNPEKRLAEYEKISLYLNSDYGPGKFRGIYTQGNFAANPVFTAWLAPLADMDCSTVSNRSVTSTDHIPFDEAGIPAFQFIQDNLEWGRGSHRATDFTERLIPDDLRHNAAVVAWLAYCAAMVDEKMPRK